MPNSILDELLQAIRSSGMSLNQISKLSGVNRSAIAAWLRGEASPTVQNAESVLIVIGYRFTLTQIRGENGTNDEKRSSDSLSA